MNTQMLARAIRADSSSTVSARSPHAPYLFADSVPFSHNFDFISVLGSFVDLAAAVLAEARAIREHEREIARARGELAENVVVLYRLENEVVERSVNLLFSQSSSAIEQVAVRLDEVARELCGRSRADLQAAFDEEASRLDSQIRQHHAAMASAVRRFFMESDLEASNERFSLILTENGYRVRLRQLVEGNITTRFEIAPEKTYWSVPRRLSDLIPGIRVAVGVRSKGFLRTDGVETRALGDYLIGRIHREGDTMEVNLRRRLEDPDSLRISLVRHANGATGRVALGPNAPFDVPPEHRQPLVALWDALRGVCVADKKARAAVARVNAGTEDLLQGGAAETLVDYLVKAYRPIVAELLDHAAASGELSLKRDLGDGRREEHFVSLSHLFDKVSALGDEERARLRKLGLEKAAPHTSAMQAGPARTRSRVSSQPASQDSATRAE